LAVQTEQMRNWKWRGGLLLICISGTLMVWSLAEKQLHDDSEMFQYRNYDKMIQRMKELNTSYPDIVDLFVAQEKFNLPYPEVLMCVEEGVPTPCKQYVMRITNESTLQIGNDTRPEVFFSGALHGNERIGPQTTMELAILMTTYATSFAKMDDEAKRKNDPTLKSKEWIWKLLNSRTVYIIPMTNAHGYFLNKREENGIDPNRDFNYATAPDCMKTMTARVINELWREHMFQLAITFHGGMRALTYEWGSPNHDTKDGVEHKSQRSPDDFSQVELGDALSMFSGAFSDGEYYKTGTMNDVVYGVNGGMEDWGYAASWENSFIPEGNSLPFSPCKPVTYGGYDEDKTIYTNFTNRAFNILVETSNDKEPDASTLGLLSDIYDVDLENYSMQDFIVGHVPQNIRMSLLLIDIVQPYVRWVSIHPGSHKDIISSDFQLTPAEEALSFEVDESILTASSCKARTNHTIHSCHYSNGSCLIEDMGKQSQSIRFTWEALGSFYVDNTHIEISTDKSFPATCTI